MSALGTGAWLVSGGAAAGGLVIVFAVLLVLSARNASGHLKTASNLADAGSPVIRAARAGSRGTTPARFTGRVVSEPLDTDGGDDGAQQHTLAQLNEYYAANISQGNAIFWASLLSMSIGFAIVFAGVVTAGTNTTATVVAGVAGVLSQFIAATFLVALRSTQQQSTTYAQTLTELRLRDLRAADDERATALGLQLLGDIAGDGALANQTRASLAMGLIVKTVPVTSPAAATTVTVPAPGDGDDARRVDPRSDVRPRIPTVSAEDRGAPAPPVS